MRQIRKGEYKYPYRLELRLNEAQMARLQSLASKSGLSMSAYVRQLIDGVLPQERPPFDFYLILSQLRYIGNNINQLALKANALGFVDTPMLKNEAVRCHKFQADIEAVLLRPGESNLKWQ